MRAPRKEPYKITSDTWDPDEAAWLKPRVDFMTSELVAFHSNKFKESKDIATEEEARAVVHHMLFVLQAMLESWTFRDRSTSYEPGKDRPILPLTLEVLGEQDDVDIVLLYTEVMNHFGAQIATPTDIITPTAAEEGLTPVNFRPRDTDDGSVPRRSVSGG